MSCVLNAHIHCISINVEIDVCALQDWQAAVHGIEKDTILCEQQVCDHKLKV